MECIPIDVGITVGCFVFGEEGGYGMVLYGTYLFIYNVYESCYLMVSLC